MPPKTTTCEVCGEQVSKRQSLAYKTGRACRDHDEVVAFIAEIAQKKADAAESVKKVEDRLKDKDKEKVNKEVHEIMTLISLTSWVQVQHSMYGHSPEAIYSHMELFRGKELTDKVRAEVEKQGGPYIDPTELIASALAVKDLMKK